MADEEQKPLLDLKTLVERPRIVVDGESYEILSPDEMSVVDAQRFGALGRRVESLMAKPTLTPSQSGELTRIVAELSDRIMIGVPEDVRERMGDSHRLSVMEVFMTLPKQQSQAAAGAETEPRTGAKPPHVSNDSTEATPPAGSPRSP